MNKNLFLLDLPESKENDAIGYEVYVDNIVAALNSDARIIGLISNYGSGKSTVINMVKNKIANDDKKMISINLWKIKEDSKRKSLSIEDNTLDVHKFLLRNLIQYLPKSSNKEYFKRKIDNNYALFNISMKNKNDIFLLYILLAVFFFNIIMKIDILNFSVSRLCNFILDLVVCIGFVYVISRSKLYLSFNKDNSKRVINESDTIECFNELIEELKKTYNNIIINIEDLDRYNDSVTVIRVLEQIYKFYIENKEEVKVKFIISLKPPYSLVYDDLQYLDNSNISLENKAKEYKELYEKLFDIIINLQTVSFQNYGVILLKLLDAKCELLKKMELDIPNNEENIGIWNYLYKGNNVTVRDIKHRYNYFINIYENLYNHKESLENKELININVETCLFVSYLEDEYSVEFYKLLDNSSDFNKLVSDFLFNKKININVEEYKETFINEITFALEKGIIDENYSMYFYKYPKDKPILNIFDSTIQNAIFTDNIKNLSDLELYCKKADINIIKKSIMRRYNESGVPEIIFENSILFKQAYALYKKEILNYLSEKYVFSKENTIKKVQKKLKKICNLGCEASSLKVDYLNILSEDLENNYDAKNIIEYRKQIIEITGLIPELKELYQEHMPTLSISELNDKMLSSNILYLTNPTNKNEDLIELIEYVVINYKIEFNDLLQFLDKISYMDKTIFKEIFYSFNLNNYSKNNIYELYNRKYSGLELDNIEELKKMVDHTKMLPGKYEKLLVSKLKNMDDKTKAPFEQLYVEMIKSSNNMSSISKKYIKNCPYYEYNFEVEKLLYDNKMYIQYVYSKCNRLRWILYEYDKFENLKLQYVYYFKNSKRLNKEYKIDKEILTYIKQNTSYKELTFEKISLLLSTPQTKEDLINIYIKDYKKPCADNSELSYYLNNIKCFDTNCENEIINYLIGEIKNKRLVIKLSTYKHIKSVIKEKSNLRKFQHVKKLCN